MRSSIRNQPLGDLLHLEQYAADFEDDTDLMILVWICVICVIPGQNQISQYALFEANWGNKTEEQLGNRTRPTPESLNFAGSFCSEASPWRRSSMGIVRSQAYPWTSVLKPPYAMRLKSKGIDSGIGCFFISAMTFLLTALRCALFL